MQSKWVFVGTVKPGEFKLYDKSGNLIHVSGEGKLFVKKVLTIEKKRAILKHDVKTKEHG